MNVADIRCNYSEHFSTSEQATTETKTIQCIYYMIFVCQTTLHPLSGAFCLSKLLPASDEQNYTLPVSYWRGYSTMSDARPHSRVSLADEWFVIHANMPQTVCKFAVLHISSTRIASGPHLAPIPCRFSAGSLSVLSISLAVSASGRFIRLLMMFLSLTYYATLLVSGVCGSESICALNLKLYILLAHLCHNNAKPQQQTTNTQLGYQTYATQFNRNSSLSSSSSPWSLLFLWPKRRHRARLVDIVNKGHKQYIKHSSVWPQCIKPDPACLLNKRI